MEMVILGVGPTLWGLGGDIGGVVCGYLGGWVRGVCDMGGGMCGDGVLACVVMMIWEVGCVGMMIWEVGCVGSVT